MRKKQLYFTSSKEKRPGLKCPRCGDSAESVTGVSIFDNTGTEAIPGAMVVCAYCGGLNIFTAALELRAVSRAERRKLVRESPWLRRPLEVAQRAVEIRMARRRMEKAAWN